MCSRCLPRFWRKATADTCPLLESVEDALTVAGTQLRHLPERRRTTSFNKSTEERSVVEMRKELVPQEDSLASPSRSIKDIEGSVRTPTSCSENKKFNTLDRNRRSGYFLRNPFKNNNNNHQNTQHSVGPLWDAEQLEETVSCEFQINEVSKTVVVVMMIQSSSSSAAAAATTLLSEPKSVSTNHDVMGVLKLSSSFPSLFRLRRTRLRNEDQDVSDLIQARRNSTASSKSEHQAEADLDEEQDHEEQEQEEEDELTTTTVVEHSRPKERSAFNCFGWGVPISLNGHEEGEDIILGDKGVALMAEAPPGLVGLENFGNTCFLNAALQCLRCTPGFTALVVPEFRNGFEQVYRQKQKSLESLKLLNSQRFGNAKGERERCDLRDQQRSHSFSSIHPRDKNSGECDISNLRRVHSLPAPLPLEVAGILTGDSGLAGGAVLRLSSTPQLPLKSFMRNQEQDEEDSQSQVSMRTQEAKENLSSHKLLEENKESKHNELCERAMRENIREIEENSPFSKNEDNAATASNVDDQQEQESITQETIGEEKTSEYHEDKASPSAKDMNISDQYSCVDLSADFITAFRKLMMELCLGDPNSHWSAQDLYHQMKGLPQAEWLCDGGQHDCQEVLKVLLDTIHAEYNKKSDIGEEAIPVLSQRCLSDVPCDERNRLDSIELETLKAESMWKRYLLTDSSPITDVFAGQLQIVRSCQKCHCICTTYEPFWDLSLSLSREKTGWFNAGRMPSSLDDLLRAFTAPEVLQGDDAPFCEKCNQKSPTTRRILIHRFPPVLVLNIKRFKYTKEGREKLTSSISFPVMGFRLENFASKEYHHSGKNPVYDLYAVSNHYGTLVGGHYTACCKVKDANSKEGWFCFNDKTVDGIPDQSVATPNAYILFYAKRQPPKN